MNAINLKRLCSMIKSEIRIKYKHYILMFAVVFFPFFWNWISRIFSANFGDEGFSVVGFSVLSLLLMVSPFILYRDLYHPVKGLSFMLKPISNTERFLTIFIQCAIILPITLGAWWALLSFINEPSGFFPYIRNAFYFRDTFEFFAGILILIIGFFAPLATAMWGVTFFKKSKLLKTGVTFIAVTSLLVWFGFILSITLDETHWIVEFFRNMVINGSKELGLAIVYAIVLPITVVLYWWSYRNIKTRQV